VLTIIRAMSSGNGQLAGSRPAPRPRLISATRD
jgi:hypothetical protein